MADKVPPPSYDEAVSNKIPPPQSEYALILMLTSYLYL